ncbi:lipid-binding SYLF domain-containing protein [Daejeonella sp. JGW-45]|uniref:lipid-binding SYLF domain-containing protein n=1 Tax=Daejeonella sp. JGW-45 TaxID=3034148 RepID=UPI0023EADC65|nr:lipid-binding SYLF domain-containing protein [Daejeonella sp. JGW-45]
MKALKKINLVVALMVSSLVVFSQEKQDEKIRKSEEVVREFGGIRENIPAQLMQRAQGIVVIPNLINAGLGIGAQRGKGVAMVKKADGSWSNPVFVTLTGGSIGFQAGVQAIDLVLVFTDGGILPSLEKGEFNLSGSASVAAGPYGRSSSAGTDTKLDAAVYSYSRSKGLFAGISLNGSKLSVDQDANSAFYKTNGSAAAIFNSGAIDNGEVASLKAAVKGL